MKIAVAVSGGIDSLCALRTLKEFGHTVLALHGTFLPNAPLPSHYHALLSSLSIPLEIVDVQIPFKNQVITPTLSAFSVGKTPNPCALCNREIKFGRLYDIARAHGYAFATGHYAARTEKDGHYLLTSPRDTSKDQSYFLSRIPPDCLPHLFFPLAEWTKDDVRKSVTALYASFAKQDTSATPAKESQDVCFLEKNAVRAPTEAGPIFCLEQTALRPMGQHRGLANYTVGQRQGLGLAYTEPLYCLKKDIAHNILYVGPKKFLGMRGVTATRCNFFLPYALWPKECFVKVRYRQRAHPAYVAFDENDCLRIVFQTPQFPTDIDQLVSITDAFGHILAGALVASQDLIVDDLLPRS